MLRVLVLDGFDETRESSVSVLRSAGYDVVGLAEEDALVDELERRGADLVLLDLPVEESIEAADAIRGRASAQPRLLAMIAHNDSGARDRARAAGIDFLILRPCPPAELLKHLRRFAP